MFATIPVKRASASAQAGAINVCFVIDRLSRAGTETQLLALVRSLEGTNIRPSLCLLDGTDAESQSLLPDCPVLCLGLKSLTSRCSPSIAVRLARFWKRERTQIVQTYFLDSTYFAVPLARLCGIRGVVRVRNNMGYWLTPWHRRLGRLMGRLAHFTLTNSIDGADALQDCEHLAPARIHVIENGVDLERFPIVPPPFSRGTIRIGIVANLRPVKNVAGFIRAATSLAAREPRAEFYIAGAGPEHANLATQIRESGYEQRIHLCGSMSDIPGLLGSLDIAVLCSHSESMSNALLEYMAAGRAIVATNVGANAKLLQHGQLGTLIPPEDDLALLEALQHYIQEPAKAQQHGAAARMHVATTYSRAQMIEHLQEFYQRVVNR